MSALETLRLGVKAVQTSSTTTGKIMTGLGKIAKNIGNFFTQGFQTAQKEVGDLLDWLGEKWEGIKEKFHTPILFDRSIADMINWVLQKLGDLKDGAGSLFTSGMEQLGEWGDAWDKFKDDHLSPIFDFLDMFTFSNLMGAFDSFVDSVYNTYQNSGLPFIVDNLRFVYDSAVDFKGEVEGAVGTGASGASGGKSFGRKLFDATRMGHTINVYNDIKAGNSYGSKTEMAKDIAGLMPGVMGRAARLI